MELKVVALVIFVLFSIFVPASTLLTSVALRRNTVSNSVRDSAYESGEESTGRRISVMGEYMHYFGLFIGLEIIVGIILVWAPSASRSSFYSGLPVIGLLVTGFILSMLFLLIARRNE